MTPFERATSLYQHAMHCGAPLEQFVLELTDAEAFAALAVLAAEYKNPALDMDLAVARAHNDPWPIMNNFLIGGFQVVRRQGELH